jgi:peptidoglycan-associated lipoprotein
MRLHSFIKLAFTLALVFAFGVSCTSCQDEPAPPPPPAPTDNGGFDQSDVESGVDNSEPTAELQTVYFDYDRASIRDDQKGALRANAAAVKAGSWSTVVVEGHCDERGSEEYNLALGERRANAIKQYLIDSGVSSSRLDTVSFGEASPAVRGHTEGAWSQNRRSEFRVVR